MPYIFQTIANFRDVGTSAGKRLRMCPNIAFRSATLDHASEEDLHELADQMGVATIIDLRSELEAALAKSGKTFSTFPVAAALKLKPSDLLATNPDPGSVKEKICPNGGRRTIMINFAGENFRKNAVWKPAPLKTKLKIASYYVSGQKPKAVKVVGEEILSRKGLAGLYRDFIDYCQYEINQALQILADGSNYPILIHCTQGKDRTGLVTALALAAVGISFDNIIEDYSKSQEGLEPVREEMVNEMAKDGLDPSFADAPPQVMEETLNYIMLQYGSIERYLDLIGFDATCRARLRQLLHQPPIPEQNELVEEVLTQQVDKPVQQNAVATEVMTPAALADKTPHTEQQPLQQPVLQQPVLQQPVLQQPVLQPVLQQPVLQPPVVLQQPPVVLQQPLLQQPVSQLPQVTPVVTTVVTGPTLIDNTTQQLQQLTLQQQKQAQAQAQAQLDPAGVPEVFSVPQAL